MSPVEPMTPQEAALRQLAIDAGEWKLADQAHHEALETRREAIVRAVRDDGLSLRVVAEAYGVTHQYISKVVQGD